MALILLEVYKKAHEALLFQPCVTDNSLFKFSLKP